MNEEILEFLDTNWDNFVANPILFLTIFTLGASAGWFVARLRYEGKIHADESHINLLQSQLTEQEARKLKIELDTNNSVIDLHTKIESLQTYINPYHLTEFVLNDVAKILSTNTGNIKIEFNSVERGTELLAQQLETAFIEAKWQVDLSSTFSLGSDEDEASPSLKIWVSDKSSLSDEQRLLRKALEKTKLAVSIDETPASQEYTGIISIIGLKSRFGGFSISF